MLLAASRWTRIRKRSQHRSDEPKAASFVFCRRPQGPLVETGPLGDVFLLCACSKRRDSVRKHRLFNEVHSFGWGHLCLFCAYREEDENRKLLKKFGVPDGI
jgi:hypothetical protein